MNRPAAMVTFCLYPWLFLAAGVRCDDRVWLILSLVFCFISLGALSVVAAYDARSRK